LIKQESLKTSDHGHEDSSINIVIDYYYNNKWSKYFGKKAASLLHMDGSIVFARWRQCAPPCNTCFLESTRVHNPNGISIGSAVFAGLTIVAEMGDRLATIDTDRKLGEAVPLGG